MAPKAQLLRFAGVQDFVGSLEQVPMSPFTSGWLWQLFVSGTQVALTGSVHRLRSTPLQGSPLSEQVPVAQMVPAAVSVDLPPLLKQSMAEMQSSTSEALPPEHTLSLHWANVSWTERPVQSLWPVVTQQLRAAAVS